MLRSSLIAASAFGLMASAGAQTPQPLNHVHKVPGAIKHAGIYHVATGTWTRTGGSISNFGASDVVYSNTATSGYFTTAGGNPNAGNFGGGAENFDEGGLPGTTNGNVFTTGPNRDEYNINGITFGYCDLSTTAGSSGWNFNFFESYSPCTVNTAPDGSAAGTGFPANGCWTVDLDLTGAEFCLGADGGAAAPGWDDDPAFDSFGWSFTFAGTGTGNAGPLLVGDPVSTDPTYIAGGQSPLDGTETYYGAISNCNSLGSGYLTRDFWWLEDPTGASTNCYFFGGYSNNNGCGGPSNPWASFYMEMRAEPGACGTPDIGTVYCNSNPNSTGSNTSIQLLGSASVAADDVTMVAGNLANNSFGFFITSQTQGFAPNPGGSQGNLCVAGNIGRFVAPGQIKSSGAGSEISLSTTAGEWSLTAIPSATGPYSAVAGGTANFQLWHRDAVGGAAVSNFSDGTSVTWN
jgi:hypothetical protein